MGLPKWLEEIFGTDDGANENDRAAWLGNDQGNVYRNF